jgi:CheY-like chemotaxis protein
MPQPPEPNPTSDIAAAPTARGAAPPCVLLIDIEPATSALFEEWLRQDGLRVRHDAHECAGQGVALILIELAFPRVDGARQLQLLGLAWPGVPVLVLSPTFLPGVAANGEVARQLGAAAVLAAPVSRDNLRSTVARALEIAR